MSGVKALIPVCLSLTLGVAAPAVAESHREEDELNRFMDLLQQQTDLATETRLNADFVPGIVSVLNHEQMQRRGFRTLWEALSSIAGVQGTMNETGMRSISIRGIGGLFETGKVKLLLNGKPLNASASATTGTLYDTPIEQIERVELIRGPGSAEYGEFAYAGVLNVITRNEGEQYSVGVDSENSISFAALYSYDKPSRDFRASLNFAANEVPGEDIDSGPDRSPDGFESYAPGPINNKRDFVSAILNVESGGLTGLLQLQQGNRGDHFGTNNLLPPDEKQTVISDTVISADLTQRFDVDEKLSWEWGLNLLDNSTEQNQLFLGTAQNFGGFPGDNDVFADTLLEERRIEGRVRFEYALDQHLLMLEVQRANVDVRDSSRAINIDPDTGLPSDGMTDFDTPVDASDERSSTSLVLQDDYYIDARTTLNTGLRLDDYEDFGSNLSPRISLVFRQSDSQVFKAQLARAFRPPSLIESNGSIDSSIEPETNDTIEFGHIYRQPELVLRNTIYFSQLDDLIIFRDSVPFGYDNDHSYSLRGYELEIEKQYARKWNLVGSLSLQDYVGDSLPGAAPWMLKLGAEYKLLPLTALHLQLNSIAEREREEGDDRNDFEQTNRLDLSLRSQNFFDVGGLDFRAGLSNLLGEELKHPAPVDTYPDDYPYSDGTVFWMQVIYQP